MFLNSLFVVFGKRFFTASATLLKLLKCNESIKLFICNSVIDDFCGFILTLNMSIPSSKMLKASKSIMAIADLKKDSPTTTNSQNVNVIVNTATSNPDKKVAYPKIDNELPPPPTQDDNPYANLPNEPTPVTRDIESAMRKTEEISESIEEKENTIKALTLIIDIIQNNPLLVNKYIVAEMETLSELIRLITNSEEVEIDTDDIECYCSQPKYRIIRRIFIKKQGDIYSLSQAPVVMRLFDNYKISLNFVI